MLDNATPEVIAAFKARKMAQWFRVSTAMPGLQLVVAGESGTEFTLVCSVDSFEESVVFGQWPHVQKEWLGPRAGRRLSDVPNERKDARRKAIDIDDITLDAIVAMWARGVSATSLTVADVISRR